MPCFLAHVAKKIRVQITIMQPSKRRHQKKASPLCSTTKKFKLTNMENPNKIAKNLCHTADFATPIERSIPTEKNTTSLITGYDVTLSLVLITQNKSCTPQMDQTIIAKEFASAAVLGSKIFYCGGRQSDNQYVNSCHSYDLGSEIGVGWREEPSMVEVRSFFSLTAVADGFIATGGYNNGQSTSSVEVFSFQDGWNREPRLEMSSTKCDHCSILMGSWLYTIGGIVDGISYNDVSNLVEAIDTTDQTATWIRKANMLERRYAHSCHVGVFEEQEGIYSWTSGKK